MVITLSKGDGLISGSVTSATGPLGGVTLTATSGQTTVNTVSLTDGNVGTFTLRNLPTPATFTVVASMNGFASQTLSLSLASGQKLTGVAITLTGSSGSLSGVVTTAAVRRACPRCRSHRDQRPAHRADRHRQPGVRHQQEHDRHLAGRRAAAAGRHTITFARSDLASQTVSVALDGGGNVTPGSLGATITSSGISTAMQSATAVVTGTVTQVGGATLCGAGSNLGEATGLARLRFVDLHRDQRQRADRAVRAVPVGADPARHLHDHRDRGQRHQPDLEGDHRGGRSDAGRADCFAYSDSYSDVPMLSVVGHPAAVNPDSKLERLARTYGWPVLTLDKSVN